MREFVVNGFLKLKLVEDHTEIYVKNSKFNQCKHLLSKSPNKLFSFSREYESMDDILDTYYEDKWDDIYSYVKISPEDIFWGYCSCLQIWAENNYDTSLLPSEFTFPLLQKLSEVGDPIASKVFKEELIKRFKIGNLNSIVFLKETGYFKYLDSDEIEVIFLENNEKLKIDIEKQFSNKEVSNIKAWVMLEILISYGDSLAKKMLIEQIMRSVMSPTWVDLNIIKNRGYLNYLKQDEIRKVIEILNSNKIKEFDFYNRFDPDFFSKIIVKIKTLKKLGFRGCNIEELPNSVGELRSLQELDLVGNKLITLPKSFSNLQSLEILDLSGNQFKSLPKEVCELVNLQELHLERNEITGLPECIGNLKNLKFLQLNSNQLVEIPQTISKLESLELIELTNNPKIPNSIEYLGDLQSLKKFYILFSELQTIPSNICNLTTLEEISLWDNNLESLPENIGNISSLTRLEIIDNKLKNLPESIGKLGSLRKLILRNNKLEKIPQSIGKLGSLEILDLGYNKLISLPKTIGNLKNLKILNLESNILNSIPTELSKLERLEELNLGRNKLNTLPSTINNLKSLKVLNLANNQLQKIPETIGDLKNLESLVLDGNPLKSIHKNVGNLDSLLKLHLVGTKLEYIPDSIGTLKSLNELLLNENNLAELPDSIGKLTFLKKLYIQNNRLTNLPDSLKNLISLDIIILYNNSINPPLDLLNHLEKSGVFVEYYKDQRYESYKKERKIPKDTEFKYILELLDELTQLSKKKTLYEIHLRKGMLLTKKQYKDYEEVDRDYPDVMSYSGPFSPEDRIISNLEGSLIDDSWIPHLEAIIEFMKSDKRVLILY